jgi:hypothetical protein
VVARVVIRRRITQADLVEIEVASLDTGAVNLREELITHGRLADAGRAAQPEKGGMVTDHRVSVTTGSPDGATHYRDLLYIPRWAAPASPVAPGHGI